MNKEFIPYEEVANEFNLTYTIVWKIKKGQTWKNV